MNELVMDQGYMQDSAGRMVPRANVKPEHLLEDELVRNLVAGADVISGVLRKFRETAFAEIKAFSDLLDQQYGVKKSGGAKGNFTLTSFDGTLRVQVAIGDYLSFGPELQTAKRLVDECLTRWSEGVNDNLRTIVNDAFQVDKEGKLQVDRILALRRLAITDATWSRAMEAISNAVRVTHSKTYVRFYRRASAEADFVLVPLDLARA